MDDNLKKAVEICRQSIRLREDGEFKTVRDAAIATVIDFIEKDEKRKASFDMEQFTFTVDLMQKRRRALSARCSHLEAEYDLSRAQLSAIDNDLARVRAGEYTPLIDEED